MKKQEHRNFLSTMIMMIVFTISLMLLQGCAGGIQSFAVERAKEQCAKPEWRRNLARAATYKALEGEGFILLVCPGTPEFEEMRAAAKAGEEIFTDLFPGGDYVAAHARLMSAISEGALGEGIVDVDGCVDSPRVGFRVCPRQPQAP